jgi:hypothetical protein
LFSLDGSSQTVSIELPRDRFEFWVRFVCGAILRPVLALMLAWRLVPDIAATWLIALCAAVFFGLVAAFWGDRFWHFLLGLFRWW